MSGLPHHPYLYPFPHPALVIGDLNPPPPPSSPSPPAEPAGTELKLTEPERKPVVNLLTLIKDFLEDGILHSKDRLITVQWSEYSAFRRELCHPVVLSGYQVDSIR